MISDIHIIEIIKDARSSLVTSISGYKDNRNLRIRLVLYDLLPMIISFFLIGLNSRLSEPMINIIITGLSIFSGLFFSLIFVVTEKAKEIKKEYSMSENDEDINYSRRYINFSKQLIAQISYAIFISLMIILLSFSTNIKLTNPFIGVSSFLIDFIPYIKFTIRKIINFSIYFLLIKFIFVFVIILSGMYSMFLEQINRKEK